MKEIVKVLLQEGIDEETIHKVLDVIESTTSTIDKKYNGEMSKTNDTESIEKLQNKKNELKSKVAANKQREEELANNKAREGWYQGVRKRPDVEFERNETKNSVGERKTRLRSGHYKYGMFHVRTQAQHIEGAKRRHKSK